MKSSTTPLILTIATLALQANATPPATKCNADNCARAVTGTAKGPVTLASHLADCSSFQWATFTPQTFTETVTVPPYDGGGGRGGSSQRRNIPRNRGRLDNKRGGGGGGGGSGRGGRGGLGSISCPTHVPAYASACSGTVRYASACSCAGITAGTVTLSTPTVTVTETKPAVTE